MPTFSSKKVFFSVKRTCLIVPLSGLLKHISNSKPQNEIKDVKYDTTQKEYIANDVDKKWETELVGIENEASIYAPFAVLLLVWLSSYFIIKASCSFFGFNCKHVLSTSTHHVPSLG